MRVNYLMRYLLSLIFCIVSLGVCAQVSSVSDSLNLFDHVLLEFEKPFEEQDYSKAVLLL